MRWLLMIGVAALLAAHAALIYHVSTAAGLRAAAVAVGALLFLKCVGLFGSRTALQHWRKYVRPSADDG